MVTGITIEIKAGPKMSPSQLHQMNVTENNETTSIPDDHTTKDQNELDIKPSNHL